MVKLDITIDGKSKTYKIPEKWEEITVGQYQDIVTIDPELKGVFLSIKLANLILSIPEEEIEDLPIEEFNNILDKMSFLNTEVVKKNKEFVKLNDELYYFKKDFNKLTTGEVASIDMILSDAEGNWYAVMDKLLCIYLRKEGETKFKTEFMQRAPLFKALPITDVINLFFSFSNGETA
jgi:hypothetical protein